LENTKKTLPNAKADKNTPKIRSVSKKDIAIIGMSAKFPGADSIEAFWDNLRHGFDCISKIPASRRNDIDNYLNYLKSNGSINIDLKSVQYDELAYLNEIDKFDCQFFYISPREANLMDPHQRLFLETAWEAVEDAGYSGGKIAGSKTGIYVGYSGIANVYQRYIESIEPDALEIAMAGNVPQIIASRLAYFLDLRGPALLVDTACSSSLVAVHLACQGIRCGECEMALAGSAKINLEPFASERNFGIRSSDRRTRTFDDAADGYGIGDGVAAVLLKPLHKALMDGDRILAVIKGSAMNQDGRSNGITAPNPEAQADVIISAWENADIDPLTITYIEAHGTATRLGDPIEISGIQRAFQRFTNQKQFCAIGTAKSNLGHLDNAAGIVGLIKTILILKHHEIPPTIHFNHPNRNISFENSPVYVNTRLRKWKKENAECLMRCGVSAFGLGGTNCHIVLEEAPELLVERPEITNGVYILTLSAKNPSRLQDLIDHYQQQFNLNVNFDLRDICFTANTGRGHYSARLAIIIRTKEELTQKLNELKDIDQVKEQGFFYGNCQLIAEADGSNYEFLKRKQQDLSVSANQKMLEFIQSNRTAAALLNEICELYVAGADIDWEQFYKGMGCRNVRLPIYPFERKRCWLEIDRLIKPIDEQADQRFYYVSKWESQEAPKINKVFPNGTILIFKDKLGISDQIIEKLKVQSWEVIEVILGETYSKNDNQFIIQSVLEDYQRLWSEIKDHNITKIIHLSSLRDKSEITDLDELEDSQRKGVFSLLNMVKVLSNHNLAHEIDLVLVSEYVAAVTSNEKRTHPENATFFALGKTIRMENLYLKCRCIDMDHETSMDLLINEIQSEYQAYQVAYRNGKRYIEVVTETVLSDLVDQPISIIENGVYLLTGGTGTIGLHMAKYLATKAKINLALINRSPLPEREQWESIIVDDNHPWNGKIKEITAIEQSGSNVLLYHQDISKRDEVEYIISDLKGKFDGKINGIIHSAGVGVGKGGLLLKDETETTFTESLAPKVKGTWLLDYFTQEVTLDFLVLFSSVITYIGGIGAGGYTTANAYLDAFTDYRNQLGKKTLTIHWPAWMDSIKNPSIDEDKQLFKFISSKTALAGFEEVLHKNIPRVIIGALNENSAFFDLIDYFPFQFDREIIERLETKKGKSPVNPETIILKDLSEINITGSPNRSYTPIQLKLIQICATVLELTEIDIFINFFDLGVDSIIAIQLSRTLEHEYPGILNIADIFSYATIYDLSVYIEDKIAKKVGEQDSSIESILDKLAKGEISINEVERMIQIKENEEWIF
jgi:acyl transferase domain-containing protein/acyl carrier protein